MCSAVTCYQILARATDIHLLRCLIPRSTVSNQVLRYSAEKVITRVKAVTI